MRPAVIGAMAGSVAVVVAIACTGGSGSLDGIGGDGGGVGTSSGVTSGGTSSGGTSGATSGGTSSGGTSGTVTPECGRPNAPAASFELKPTTGSYCAGARDTCSAQWLTILRESDKTPLATTRPCNADCGDCQAIGCTAECAQPQLVGSSGTRTSWAGTIFDPGNCQPASSGSSLQCSTLRCAPAGRYIARMCVYRAGDGGPDACQRSDVATVSTCTDVTFDWPTTSVISGSL